MKAVTSSKLAELLGVTKGTILRMAQGGQIPYLRLPSGHYRFYPEDVRKALEMTPLDLLEQRRKKIEQN